MRANGGGECGWRAEMCGRGEGESWGRKKKGAEEEKEGVRGENRKVREKRARELGGEKKEKGEA